MKAVVMGAASLIGRKIIELLGKSNFPITELIAVDKNSNKLEPLFYNHKEIRLLTPEQALQLKPDFAFFTGDVELSSQWAKKFAEQSCYVIDNSPTHRNNELVKLIIPEINAKQIQKHDFLISSPNCTSIQLAMVLAPLHKHYKIKRVVVTTFQAVSGAGQAGIDHLDAEINGENLPRTFPNQVFNNTIPHVDEFTVNGYTSDEVRLMNEIKKIIGDPNIHVSATCTRVPVKIGHSESVNIEFENDFVLYKLKSLLESFDGVKMVDDPQNNKYPMPLLTHENDDVFVGRIRRDYSNPHSLNLWTSANNIRRGAATNAVNIMEAILNKYF